MDKKGFALTIVLAFVLILVMVAASFITLTNNEIKITQYLSDSLKAFYLAEAGVEKALYKLTKDQNYNGETAPLGEGEYTALVTPLAGYVQIDSTGFIPKTSAPRAVRKIRVTAKKRSSGVAVGGAVTGLTKGREIEVKGSCSIDGVSMPGIRVPEVSMVKEFGTAHEIKGLPDPIVAEDPSRTFQQIFGMTKEELKLISTVYTDPKPNDPDPLKGIVWIEGDAKFTYNSWKGEGILIVTGELTFTGGIFKGIMYAGSLKADAGNPILYGGMVTEGDGKFAGTADIIGDKATLDNLNAYFPYERLSWEEI